MFRWLVTIVTLLALAYPRADAQAPARVPAAATDGERFQQALTLMEARRDYLAAARLFEQVAAGPDRSQASRALVYAGLCYERLGRTEAERLYRRVLSQYADQPSAVREARARLQALSRAGQAASPPTVTLRQAWPGRPPGASGFGSASADAKVIVTPLEGADAPVALLDSATGRLLPPRFVLNRAPAGRPRPCKSTIPFVVSLDRTQLAYSCEIEGDRQELRIATTDGASRLLRRTDAGQSVDVWQWTAQGDLAATLNDASRHPVFVLIAARDGREHRGLTLPAIPRTLTVSPDGRWVVYDGPSMSGDDDDVYIGSVPDGPATVLLGGSANDVHPTWTPDGTRVLFVSDRTGTSGLWMQAVQEGRAADAPRVLQQDVGRVVKPFGVTDTGAYLYFRQLGFPDVYSVRLGTTGTVEGTPTTLSRAYAGSNMFPAWSPDGTRVAFVAQLGYGSRRVIAIRDVNGDTQRSVQTTLVWIYRLCWSPDGHRLLAKGRDRSGQYGLHLVDVDTGASSLLLGFPPSAETDLGGADWGLGGSSVVYWRSPGPSAPTEFHSLDVGSGTDRVLFTLPIGTWPGGLSVSRETGAIALALFRDTSGAGNATGSEVVIRGSDGSMRTVFTTTAEDLVYSVAWLPGDRHLVLVRRVPGPDQVFTLWRLDSSSGEVADLSVGMPALRDVQVSPDGHAVAFTAGLYSRRVWVLENFLPASSAVARAETRKPRKP